MVILHTLGVEPNVPKIPDVSDLRRRLRSTVGVYAECSGARSDIRQKVSVLENGYCGLTVQEYPCVRYEVVSSCSLSEYEIIFCLADLHERERTFVGFVDFSHLQHLNTIRGRVCDGALTGVMSITIALVALDSVVCHSIGSRCLRASVLKERDAADLVILSTRLERLS
jgi:hypothetical protein